MVIITKTNIKDNVKYEAEEIDDIQEKISILENTKSSYQKRIRELQDLIIQIDSDLSELKKA